LQEEIEAPEIASRIPNSMSSDKHFARLTSIHAPKSTTNNSKTKTKNSQAHLKTHHRVPSTSNTIPFNFCTSPPSSTPLCTPSLSGANRLGSFASELVIVKNRSGLLFVNTGKGVARRKVLAKCCDLMKGRQRYSMCGDGRWAYICMVEQG